MGFIATLLVPTGLHMRPAHEISECIRDAAVSVWLEQSFQRYDVNVACPMLSLICTPLELILGNGGEFNLHCTGEDSRQVLCKLLEAAADSEFFAITALKDY